MITLFQLLAIPCLLFNVSTFAIDYYWDGYRGTTLINRDLPTFRILRSAQPGQKIWESRDINITVYCDNAPGWSSNNPSENVYAWIKLPQINSADMLNNPHLTFSVTYNGVDYEGTNEKIDTRACLDKYEQYYSGYCHDPICNSNTLQRNVTFNAHFRVYVRFKSRPAGDQTVNFGTVNVLQFDDEDGANMVPNAKNLRYAIMGSDNISFLGCNVDVCISPESQTVNFRQIAANSITTFPLKAAFSVSAIEDIASDCTEQFDVAASFFTSGTLYDNTHLGIGNGLLMRITDQETQEDIKFNQFKLFSTYISGQSAVMATRDYQAELTQKPGEPLIYDPFQKDPIVKISYH